MNNNAYTAVATFCITRLLTCFERKPVYYVNILDIIWILSVLQVKLWCILDGYNFPFFVTIHII